MSNFNTITNNISSLRENRTILSSELAIKQEELVQSTQAVVDAKRNSIAPPSDLNELISQTEAIGSEVESLSGEVKVTNEGINQNIALLNQTDPTVLIENLDDRFPILLFPIRVETRFMKVKSKGELSEPVIQVNNNVLSVLTSINNITNDVVSTLENPASDITALGQNLITQLNGISIDLGSINETVQSEYDQIANRVMSLSSVVGNVSNALTSQISDGNAMIASLTANNVSTQALNTTVNAQVAALSSKVNPVLTAPTAQVTQHVIPAMLAIAHIASTINNAVNPKPSEIITAYTSIQAGYSGLTVVIGQINQLKLGEFNSVVSTQNQLQEQILDLTKTINEAIPKEVTAAENRVGIKALVESNLTKVQDAHVEISIVTQPPPSPVIKITDELWVRFYPDDIANETHESLLKEDEKTLGENYWKSVWNSKGELNSTSKPNDEVLGQWRFLISAVGTQRAAWIVKSTTPTNYILFNENNIFGTANQTIGNAVEKVDNLLSADEILSEDLIIAGDMLNSTLNQVNASLSDVENALPKEISGLLNNLAEVDKTKKDLFYTLQTLLGSTFDVIGGGLIDLIDTSFNELSLTVGRIVPVENTDQTVYENTEPIFPINQAKSKSWTSAPKSFVMPDNFVVTLYNNSVVTHQVVGNTIPDPLIVGPDPQSDLGFEQTESGDLNIEDGIKWMFDFNEAVRVGMAVRIQISSNEADPTNNASGFDKIVVLGVKNSASSTNAQVLLENLIDSHHYTTGFSLVPQGTPTNNTETSKSTYSKFAANAEESFKIERSGPLFTAAQNRLSVSDGQFLSNALGIKEEVLQNIHYADGYDICDAIAMNYLMWQGTLGTYMEDMFNTVLTVKNIHVLRDFFGAHVRGRGSLPAFRVGDQPYGVLPATAFSRFNFKSNNSTSAILQDKNEVFLNKMKFFLVNILDAKKWEQHKNELKNVDSPSNSISASQEVFMRILSQEASSVEFHQRLSTAQGFFGGFQNILAEAKNTSSNSSWQNTLWTDLSTEFGSFFEDLLTNGDYVNSKIFETVYTKISRKLTSELIDDLPISENRGLSEENNYIEYLKNERLETIKNDFTAKNQPSKSIFFTMMSHALFMQYWDAAMNILTTAGQLEPETSPGSGDRKNYLHFNGAGTGTVPPNSKWYFLFSKLIGLRGASGQTMTMAEFLQSSEAGNYKSDTKHLREMFEALDVLSKLSTAKIERAFAEHVDLCTYRLDAWQLGMVDKRMTDCRNQDLYHKGIYLGSSGYLENLKPGGIRKDVNGNSIVFDFESGTESPIAFDPENQGYVHGPSIPHAVTAAILRGGYTAHKNETTTNNAMAVNLSSERVRKAINLIDGIRGGQQLSALLGYQFERGLHDNSDNAELDQYILDIRLKFPLVANKLLATNDNSAMDIETLEARNVVDGLALLSASQKTPYPYGISLPLLNDPLPAKAKAAQEIKAEIDRLADSLDALGDLLMSESVYQLAKGNHERSNSVMNALSKSTHIPEPEIVKTPRTGHSITHRVIINFEPLRRSNKSTDATGKPTTEMVDLTSANYNPWASANVELTMRAKANLSLNKWLGKIFGDPNKIQTVIRYTDPTNQTEISDTLSVAELKIQPIDLLHFMSSDFDLVDTKTDLGRLITYYGKRKLELQENIDLIIDFSERDSLWANDILTLFEMAPLASNLMKTIAESRALHPDDIVLPGSEITEQGGVDIKELETRLFNESNNGTLDEIEQLLSELQLAKDNLELDETFDAQLFENIRELLLKTYILGFGNRFNYPVTNDAESKLFYKDEIQIMINKTVKIYKKARSLYSLYTADSLNKEQILLDIFKLFYGKKSFPIIEFLKNNPSDFNLGILEKPNTSNTTIMKWISGITKVRKKIMNYNNLNSYFSLLKNDELKLEPIQLCTTKLNYWVGMEFPVNPDPSDPTMQPPKGDVLSLVLENNTPGFDISNGMIIDDWVEMIPIKEVTTGVAFHYDQPNAKPPQSLIMAVTPEIKGNWSWKNVIDTIIETMELAKKRAVEPDELAKTLVETETVTNNMLFSHILPCVLTEISQKNVTISGNLNAALDAVS